MIDPADLRLVKHSISIAGHRTSISLEEAFWTAFSALATRRTSSVAALVAEIDGMRGEANLSSAIRVFVLRATQEGSLPPSRETPA